MGELHEVIAMLLGAALAGGIGILCSLDSYNSGQKATAPTRITLCEDLDRDGRPDAKVTTRNGKTFPLYQRKDGTYESAREMVKQFERKYDEIEGLKQ